MHTLRESPLLIKKRIFLEIKEKNNQEMHLANIDKTEYQENKLQIRKSIQLGEIFSTLNLI